jgi:hypothetical protein
MYDESYLAHHGIKGQKWGVRRFQNPDGTRTALGKKHERESIGNRIDKEKLFAQTIKGGKDRPNVSPAEKLAKEAGSISTEVGKIAKTVKKAKDVKNGRESKKLSDQELKKRIERLNLEKQYESLMEDDYTRGHVTANDILSTVGSVVTIGASVATMIAVASTLKK